MLLKLIKTRPMISGVHAELWIKDHVFGDKKLADVFVLNELLPVALIYPIRIVSGRICIRNKPFDWEWDNPKLEEVIVDYLRDIQVSGEEIYLDICDPEPYLPGYPYIDYHPDDYPEALTDDCEIVFLDDLDEDEKPEEPYEIPEYC